jgi:uncharacterized protein YukE
LILGGGGTGFPYPPGDPGAISGAAGALSDASSQLSTAAGQVSSAASAVQAYWDGPAYQAFVSGVGSIRQGLDTLAGYHADSAQALTVYAAALTKAQSDATNAATGYQSAESDYSDSINRLQSNPPTGHNATTLIADQEGTALNTLGRAFSSANTVATNACDDAKRAAAVCAAKLSELAGEIQDTALHKFLDLMGGPGTVLGTLGIEEQTRSAWQTYEIIKAMNTGDYQALKAYDPQGWADVEKVAHEFGPQSMQALRAEMEFEEKVGQEVFGDMADAAISLDKVAGGFKGAVDVLGKLGLLASVASDVMIFADGQSSGGDKVAAGVNLAGVGMTALGSDLGTAALRALMIGALPDAIPVVGEILIAGTALYFGTEWVTQHWGEIEQWGSDVGHDLASAYHWVGNGLESAGNWAAGEVMSGVDSLGSALGL